MVTEVLSQREIATNTFSALRWSTTAAKLFRPKELWMAISFTGIAVVISLGLAYATVSTGIDLTIGSAPMDMTLTAAPVGH
jgi:predicted ABC-type sugar transport system permease subunit